MWYDLDTEYFIPMTLYVRLMVKFKVTIALTMTNPRYFVLVIFP